MIRLWIGDGELIPDGTWTPMATCAEAISLMHQRIVTDVAVTDKTVDGRHVAVDGAAWMSEHGRWPTRSLRLPVNAPVEAQATVAGSGLFTVPDAGGWRWVRADLFRWYPRTRVEVRRGNRVVFANPGSAGAARAR